MERIFTSVSGLPFSPTGTAPMASTTFGAAGAEIEIIKPEVANGIITVTYSNAAPQSANQAINGSTLTLTPNTANPGAIDWDCSSANLAAKHLPSACR